MGTKHKTGKDPELNWGHRMTQPSDLDPCPRDGTLFGVQEFSLFHEMRRWKHGRLVRTVWRLQRTLLRH